MTSSGNFIAGNWLEGRGDPFTSLNPATEEIVWQGKAADPKDVEDAVSAARSAFGEWSNHSLDERLEIVEKFGLLVAKEKDRLAALVSQEMGKPLWDAAGEIGVVPGKIALSVKAIKDRTGEHELINDQIRSSLSHRPLGILAVFGPFNFPAHLPNGHIVPGLLAGNTIIFKPSEQTPLVAIEMVKLWEQAGIPPGVLNLVQGSRQTGEALVGTADINGVLFTGSAATGHAIAKKLADRPEIILALELGGNNPLIVDRVSDLEAAAKITIQSAFITSGQRCTCARRLIVPKGDDGDRFLNILSELIDNIRVGVWNQDPAPFMGPLASAMASTQVFDKYEEICESGAVPMTEMRRMEAGHAFLSPGLVDVTNMTSREDEEVFGPLLQVLRVEDFAAAIEEANNTRFGLAAGLLSDDEEQYHAFRREIRAGVVNWNRPTTGASGAQPFGGHGASGNHRPSAYYAADYCADPVAHLEDVEGRVRFEGSIPGVDD